MVAKKTRSPVIKNDPFADFEAIEEEKPSPEIAKKPKVQAKAKAKKKQKPKVKEVAAEETVETKVECDMATKARSKKNLINLGDSLGIQNVATILTDIKSAIDLGSPVELNGGDVERIDGAGLQLLSILMKTSAENGVAVSWSSSSETLIEGAKGLGLQELLRL
jgi:anti-anti-sigma regulatory factor